jgi:hypothetical protein
MILRFGLAILALLALSKQTASAVKFASDLNI